jgi:hypothetical protein
MLLVRSSTLAWLALQGLLMMTIQCQAQKDSKSNVEKQRGQMPVLSPDTVDILNQNPIKAKRVTQQNSLMFEEAQQKQSIAKQAAPSEDDFEKESSNGDQVEEPAVLPELKKKKKKNFGKKLLHEVEDLAPIVAGGMVAAATGIFIDLLIFK